MVKIKFLKDHSSGFRKGQIVDMPKDNVSAWTASGYAEVLTVGKPKKSKK